MYANVVHLHNYFSQSGSQYQPVSAVAYSQQQNTSHPIQYCWAYPLVVQDANQASSQPPQPIPEPDGVGDDTELVHLL